jgi:hypothetical protein
MNRDGTPRFRTPSASRSPKKFVRGVGQLDGMRKSNGSARQKADKPRDGQTPGRETERRREGEFEYTVKNQTDVMPKLQRNKADVGIDPNARSAQGRSGRSGPKASGARNWIKHKSLGSPNEKCGTCEESNDQAYKARKSEREDRGCTQTRTKVSGPEPS